MPADNPNRDEAAGARYRPDIDGLRALAVLPVVFYHFGIPPFSGGFVGVDVFFVISGYLITALIHAEMARGTFSFVSFYERRIRRIFPALIAVLLVTFAAGMVFLLPGDLIRYGKSLTATAIFGSNFRFWREAGYFDVAAELKPLLHTWSLAVEEQFYLLFPLILYLARRAGRRTLLAIVFIILVASLAESVWAIRHWPEATFYLLPARMWELMIGALLAIGAWRAPTASIGAVCTAAGVALIAFAVFAYDAATPFPGLAALPPCLGAGLVIYGGSSRNAASGILGSRGLVLVGLISYSLYLWHWPVLVFAKYYEPDPLSAVAKAGLVGLSGGLAWLSWRYVERPFRGHASTVGRRAIFAGAVAAIALLATLGGIPKWTDGLPQRFPSDIRAILAEGRAADAFFRRCQRGMADRVRDGTLCRLGVKAGVKPSILLWGDSHASSVAAAIDIFAMRRGLAGLLATTPSCPPLLGVKPRAGSRNTSPACPGLNAQLEHLATSREIGLVVLAARWAAYAEGTGFRQAVAPPQLLTDDEASSAKGGDNHAVFERGLRRTVAALIAAGKRVVVVAPIPEIGPDVPETVAKARLLGAKTDIRPTLDDYRARQAFVLQVLDRLARDFPVAIVYPDRLFCAPGRCEIEIAGRPIYRDGQHLSEFGAAQLVPLFDQAIR